MKHLARAVRVGALTFWWLLLVPCLLWIATYVQFFFVQPREAQNVLFGRQVVGLSSLRAARNDCCLIPLGDGRVEWTYELSPEVAATLERPCERSRVQFQPDGCRIAERNFPGDPPGINGGYSAVISGNRLIIAIDWL